MSNTFTNLVWTDAAKTQVSAMSNGIPVLIPADPRNRDFASLDPATIGAYTPPPVTPADGAAAALAAGLTITSTGTPTLDGTYALVGETQIFMLAEMVSLSANGTFTNGSTTILWPDVSGGGHSFNPTQFKNLAAACGAYINALKAIISNDAGTLPANTVTVP